MIRNGRTRPFPNELTRPPTCRNQTGRGSRGSSERRYRAGERTARSVRGRLGGSVEIPLAADAARMPVRLDAPPKAPRDEVGERNDDDPRDDARDDDHPSADQYGRSHEPTMPARPRREGVRAVTKRFQCGEVRLLIVL